MKSTRAHPRGQAVVETTLGIIVYAGLLLGALLLLDYTFSARSHLAATLALWDTTGKKLHDLPGDYRPLQQAVSAANQTQYVYGPSDRLMTRWSLPTIQCSLDPSLGRNVAAPVSAVYQNLGGIRCAATSVVSPRWNDGTINFLNDANGFFGVPIRAGNGGITICSSGRFNGGACSVQFPVLLDDWGLAGTRASPGAAFGPTNETAQCRMVDGANCENKAYYQSVRAVYRAGGGGAEELASYFAGAVPYQSSTFFMSFRGEESGFQEVVPAPEAGPASYTTSPGGPGQPPLGAYRESFNRRKACFLGRSC